MGVKLQIQILNEKTIVDCAKALKVVKHLYQFHMKDI